MNVYHVALLAFSSVNGYLLYRQYRHAGRSEISEKTQDHDGDEALLDGEKPDEDGAVAFNNSDGDAAAAFARSFFLVYGLICASDWFQGPFIYTLYKDEKQLPEQIVARLFTTGFVAAALSALFIGSLADKYGRRFACLVCCAVIALSCLTTLSNNLSILFLGRALGGVGTTLMYTVFEAWMVTEYHQRGLEHSGMLLSTILGRMWTLSSVVAIVTGLVGQTLVGFTGTKCAPFVASIICLVPAAALIVRNWTENYGDQASSSSNDWLGSLNLLRGVDKQILILGLASCCFEGTMYLFIYFWSPGLKAVHPPTSSDLPFGLIFASFMCAMMLGSMLFTTIRSRKILSCRELLQYVTALAGISLLITTLAREENATFLLYCLFEACIGLYFPCMGYMKGKVVGDGNRAHVYGLLRIPYNVFVVVALGLTREGDHYREMVFIYCSGLLLLVSVAVGRFLQNW